MAFQFAPVASARTGSTGGACASAGPRQAGQRVERRGGGVVARQQAPIGDRPDAFRAGKAQAVQRVGRSSGSLAGSCLLTNAWLGAGEQAADVRVMADEHQHGDHQRKLNDA